jgi:hypothetical protein
MYIMLGDEVHHHSRSETMFPQTTMVHLPVNMYYHLLTPLLNIELPSEIPLKGMKTKHKM